MHVMVQLVGAVGGAAVSADPPATPDCFRLMECLDSYVPLLI